jgi:hypothetical protein
VNSGPDAGGQEAGFDDASRRADQRRDTGPFVLRTCGGQRPVPPRALDFLGAKPADFAATSAGQKLKPENVRGVEREDAAIKR